MFALEESMRNQGAPATDRVVPGLVSVIIPVFNERDTVETVLQALDQIHFSKEIILVDDGSTDGTGEVVGRAAARFNVTAIAMDRNYGKGMAFRRGLAEARGEVVIIQDADLEYDPSEIPTVVAPILGGQLDVCYGSRILGPSTTRSTRAFYWGGRLVSWVTSLLYGIRVTDEPTCYKAFRASILRKIPLEGCGFELEPEMTAKVLRLGLRYGEVGISYNPRKPDQGKKINWKDGLRALWTLVLWRFRSFEVNHN